MTAGDQKLRLLAVARWPVGGIRTYMRYTYAWLPEDMELTILANRTQEAGMLVDDAAGLGAGIVLVDGGTRELASAVWRELRRGGHHVVQSHGFNAAAASFLPCRLASRPHMLTVHGILEQRFLAGFKGRLKRLGLERILAGLDAIHAVGQDIRDHLASEMPRITQGGVRCEIIPNGVDTHRFRGCRKTSRGLRTELGIGDDEFLFGFLGRLMPQKGFDLLIRAVERLAGRDAGFRVLVAASGDYIREYTRDIQELGLNDRFVFIPHLEDVRRVYAAVDAVVMPSRWEAWSLLKAEALASGTPLVASTCMGLHEDIEDSPAVFVRPDDWQDLCLGMERMLAMEDREQVFAGFAPIAVERFAASRSAERLSALVRDIGAGSQGRTPAGQPGVARQ